MARYTYSIDTGIKKLSDACAKKVFKDAEPELKELFQQIPKQAVENFYNGYEPRTYRRTNYLKRAVPTLNEILVKGTGSTNYGIERTFIVPLMGSRVHSHYSLSNKNGHAFPGLWLFNLESGYGASGNGATPLHGGPYLLPFRFEYRAPTFENSNVGRRIIGTVNYLPKGPSMKEYMEEKERYYNNDPKADTELNSIIQKYVDKNAKWVSEQVSEILKEYLEGVFN